MRRIRMPRGGAYRVHTVLIPYPVHCHFEILSAVESAVPCKFETELVVGWDHAVVWQLDKVFMAPNLNRKL